MAIRVTRHVQACPKPPTYFEYKRGIVYDEDTFPPAPVALQQQAVSEGWAVLEVAPEPPKDRLLDLAEAFGFAAGDLVETEQGTAPLRPHTLVDGNGKEWGLRLVGVTDLQGNPIPVGPDGLIHGEPLRGLTDEERAALPELLPQDAPAGEMVLMEGLPGPSEQLPGAYYPDGAQPLLAWPPGEVSFDLELPPLVTGDSHPVSDENLEAPGPAPKPADPPTPKPPTKPSKSRKRGR